jgi:hypothetical protein
MNDTQSHLPTLKQRAADCAIALYCVFGSIWLFAVQTGKLFRIDEAAAEMADSPAGQFEWGFVWSDTLVLGPFVLIGSILLIGRRTRLLGHLLAFSGFAINLYTTVFILVGYWAGGKPWGVGQTLVLLVTAVLGAVCMVYSAIVLLRRNYRDQRPVHAAGPGS